MAVMLSAVKVLFDEAGAVVENPDIVCVDCCGVNAAKWNGVMSSLCYL